MWYVMVEYGYGEVECVNEFDNVDDAVECCNRFEDAWISSDEDADLDDGEYRDSCNLDDGFDSYEGCYTYDCQVWQKK